MHVSPALLSLVAFILVQTAIVAFALGRLFQRVSAIEKTDDGSAGDSRAITRLEVEMKHVTDMLEKQGRDIQVMQRQLGNLVTGRASAVYEFPPAGSVPGE